tara:strand:- start:290 stop:1231 length:942 start_codon:yes stop_codon:yes gene_type:complete
MRIFITGISGFIGFHTALKLDSENHIVFGIDNFNDSYDVDLKRARQKILKEKNIEVIEDNVLNVDFYDVLVHNQVDVVIHLAAYSNVRRSLEEPLDYMINNVAVTNVIIDACETYNIQKVLYASTSCVMEGQELPWKDTTKEHYHFSSPYGWSKFVNECQFKASKIPLHYGMRFFTVYGPYGRPDMAVHSFTKDIIDGKKLTVFGRGKMKRDFTYIDDAVNAINILVDNKEKSNIYNISHGQSVYIMDVIDAIETNLGIKSEYDLVDKHPAEVMQTWGDISTIRYIGYDPKVHYTRGVEKFVTWYKQYYGKLN